MLKLFLRLLILSTRKWFQSLNALKIYIRITSAPIATVNLVIEQFHNQCGISIYTSSTLDEKQVFYANYQQIIKGYEIDHADAINGHFVKPSNVRAVQQQQKIEEEIRTSFKQNRAAPVQFVIEIY